MVGRADANSVEIRCFVHIKIIFKLEHIVSRMCLDVRCSSIATLVEDITDGNQLNRLPLDLKFR